MGLWPDLIKFPYSVFSLSLSLSLALHVKFGDCNPPETFCHVVSAIHHAFTHQIMIATVDFIAPFIHPDSCLSHVMFDV